MCIFIKKKDLSTILSASVAPQTILFGILCKFLLYIFCLSYKQNTTIQTILEQVRPPRQVWPRDKSVISLSSHILINFWKSETASEINGSLRPKNILAWTHSELLISKYLGKINMAAKFLIQKS